MTAGIGAVRSEYEGLCARWAALTDAERAVRLDAFSQAFAYNSGRIENRAITEHDTREVFRRKRVASFSGELKTLYEIDNQRIAWAWMVQEAKPGVTLTETMVRRAHHLLTRMTYGDDLWASGERPGSYKVGDFGVGVGQWVGYAPDEVPDAVRGLCSDVSAVISGDLDCWGSLTAGAYVHAMLAEIHPFADGNGRTARLLENLVRLSLGQPPSIVLEQDRVAYYGALDQFHEDGRLDGLRDFVMVECLKAGRMGRAHSAGRSQPEREAPERRPHTVTEVSGTCRADGGGPCEEHGPTPRPARGGDRGPI